MIDCYKLYYFDANASRGFVLIHVRFDAIELITRVSAAAFSLKIFLQSHYTLSKAYENCFDFVGGVGSVICMYIVYDVVRIDLCSGFFVKKKTFETEKMFV